MDGRREARGGSGVAAYRFDVIFIKNSAQVATNHKKAKGETKSNKTEGCAWNKPRERFHSGFGSVSGLIFVWRVKGIAWGKGEHRYKVSFVRA